MRHPRELEGPHGHRDRFRPEQLEEVADAKPFNHGRIPDGSGLPQPIRDVTSAVQDTPDVDLAATGHVEDKAGEALERP